MSIKEQFVSKKLGVVATAIVSLHLITDKPPETAKMIACLITAIAITYMIIQGILDYKKEKKDA